MSTAQPTTYMVLVYDDEDAWDSVAAAGSRQDQAAMYARDEEFAEALAQRGHRIVGGAELTHSRQGAVVRADRATTQGPYAESVEQLSGFYLVQSADREDLLRLAQTMARADEQATLPPRIIEVRACGGQSEPPSSN